MAEALNTLQNIAADTAPTGGQEDVGTPKHTEGGGRHLQGIKPAVVVFVVISLLSLALVAVFIFVVRRPEAVSTTDIDTAVDALDILVNEVPESSYSDDTLLDVESEVPTIDEEVSALDSLNTVLEEDYSDAFIDELITTTLVENELDKNDITITKDEIDKKLKDVEENLGETTLEEILEAQNMTMEDVIDQISLQLRVEKFLADSVEVTPEEITEFIDQYSNQFGEETSAEEREAQAIDYLVDQKMQTEINTWIGELRETATISTYL
jgi:parvulin-like peptidyl-prolyl isomerase